MKQLKFKILSIAIGLLLSFLIGELIARVYFFGRAAFSYSRTNSFGIIDNSGLLKYADSEDLKYELLPNLDTKYKLVDFKTNAEGFRDRNHKANPNTVKIAVLGDSFTMGTGVQEQEMYVSQTEKLLNASNKNVEYELFNFGVSGYALTSYKSILERNALKYNPDLVVIGFCGPNDHYRIGIDFPLDNFIFKPKKNVFWDSYLKKLLIIKFRTKIIEPVPYKAEHAKYIDEQFQDFQNIFIKNNSKGIVFYMDLVYDPIHIAHIKKLAKKKQFALFRYI